MKTLLQTYNLGKRYGQQWAVRGVSLRIGAGERIALLGPNGAGKSTLLRMLATVTRPSSGEVQFAGDVGKGDPRAARGKIGFVGHRSFLYGALSVSENLSFYASLYGVENSRGRIQTMTERFGLQRFAFRPVAQLSRGLEQRAALARALLHDPLLLLLDEPFSGLDAEASAVLTDILEQEAHSGVALVMSTHEFSQAEQLCNRALVLKGGQLVFDGPLSRPLARHYREIIEGSFSRGSGGAR